MAQLVGKVELGAIYVPQPQVWETRERYVERTGLLGITPQKWDVLIANTVEALSRGTAPEPQSLRVVEPEPVPVIRLDTEPAEKPDDFTPEEVLVLDTAQRILKRVEWAANHRSYRGEDAGGWGKLSQACDTAGDAVSDALICAAVYTDNAAADKATSS